MTRRLIVCALLLLAAPGTSAAQTALSYAPVIGAMTPTSFDVHVRTDGPATVQAVIDSQASAAVWTEAAHDYTARLSLSGLQPDTTYSYTVLVDGVPTITRTVRTFPAESAVRPVRVVVWADHDRGQPVEAYASGLAEQPDLTLQIGDFPHWNPATSEPRPETVGNWWAMHRTILAEAFAAPQTSSVPLLQMPDDHDAAKNNAALRNKPAWRAFMLQAHDDYFPSYPRDRPTEDLGQSFQLGAHVTVCALDVRSQKDTAHAIEQPGHTMLGVAQLAAVKACLQRPTPWKLVVSPLAFNRTPYKVEAWAGFLLERTEILDFVRTQGITGVVWVTGDLHHKKWLALDDGTYADLPEVGVPGTNTLGDCTSSGCGQWSHGGRAPSPAGGGYAVLDLTATDLTATIKNRFGVTQGSMTVTTP